MDVAAALGEHLSGLSFADRSADDVTALLIDAVVDWAGSRQWRAYRRAASVMPLPPPYERQFSVVDVGIARPAAPPIVVEVDHADRRRTVEKLAAEAAAGRVAVWVRWGAGRLAAPPPPVLLVPFAVITRRGPSGARVHSHPAGGERPAPEHSPSVDAYAPMPLDPEA